MKSGFSKFYLFIFVLSLSTSYTHAQCLLVESVTFSPANKKISTLKITYDSNKNIASRCIISDGINTLNTFEYDNQNKLLKTQNKTGDKVVSEQTFLQENQGKKISKQNLFGKKSFEEIISSRNKTEKIFYDENQNVTMTEKTEFQNGLLKLKETKNAKNEIVSRETLEYNLEQKITKTENFDGMLKSTLTENFTYSTDNQIIKSEKLENQVLKSWQIFTYQNKNLQKAETFKADGTLDFYTEYTYRKDTETQTTFYAGVLHSSKIITFDKFKNAVFIQNFNENKQPINKIQNQYDCKK
jgi:antitoxin component YwqK of YwqJK toxin-antitoxin module